MTNINALGTAVPDYAYAQSDLLAFMLKKIPMHPVKQEKLSQFYARSGIKTRHSVLPDFGSEERQLFASDNASLSERMAVYEKAVVPLALNAIQNCFDSQSLETEAIQLQEVTHLIAVTCTGMSAPGLDLMLLRALDLPTHTERTCVHYMGCYAAMHALKQAHAIVRSEPDAVVLVVCAELCTLHFQQEESLDSLASSLLFADGAGAALLSRRGQSGLRLEHFYSEVMLEGWQEMAWNLSESGFIMRLGSEVPVLLQEGMSELVTKAMKKFDWRVQPDFWALHPGGRKILDLTERALHLSPEALNVSRKILSDYGNMSSPTVLFVLKEILSQCQNTFSSTDHAEAKIFAAAFGPGLTMESAGLSYVV